MNKELTPNPDELDALIARITPESARAYLEKTGWRRLDFPGQWFVHENGAHIGPMQNYFNPISIIVHFISGFESRSSLDVARDMAPAAAAVNEPQPTKEEPAPTESPNLPACPPLRIAFCGPGCSGKTTLATQIARELGLPLIKEQIREAAKLMGIETVNGLSDDQRYALQLLGFSLQLAQEEKYRKTGFVSDRSLWDYSLYTQAISQQLKSPKFAKLEEFMCYASGIMRDRYGFWFKVERPQDAVNSDGFRFKNADDPIEKFIISYYSEYTIPDTKSPTNDTAEKQIEARLNMVRSHLVAKVPDRYEIRPVKIDPWRGYKGGLDFADDSFGLIYRNGEWVVDDLDNTTTTPSAQSPTIPEHFIGEGKTVQVRYR